MLYTGSHFVLAINFLFLKMLMITLEAPLFFLVICMKCVEQLELEIE